MIGHLTDTDVFSEIFKGNADVKKFVEGFENSIDSAVYVECLQDESSDKKMFYLKTWNFPKILHS